MWLPDMWRSPPYLLRLGQAFIQLWQFNGRDWAQIESQAVHHLAHDQYTELSELLPGITQALPEGARVQVLADSKWMPVSMILTGSKPLSRAQIDVLAKHRFSQIFGEHAKVWNIQSSYVAGDAQTMAFACPSGLLTGLRQGIEAQQPGGHVRHRLVGLAPTLSWTWEKIWRSGAGQAGTWLVLAEQDRSILVWAPKGQALGLQPAGPTLQSPAHLDKVLRTEALRFGVFEESTSVAGFSFEAMPEMATRPSSDAFHWQVLGTQGSTK